MTGGAREAFAGKNDKANRKDLYKKAAYGQNTKKVVNKVLNSVQDSALHIDKLGL